MNVHWFNMVTLLLMCFPIIFLAHANDAHWSKNTQNKTWMTCGTGEIVDV